MLFHGNALFWLRWLCLLVWTVISSPTTRCWTRTCYSNSFRPWRGGERASVPPAARLQVMLGFPGTLHPHRRQMELAFISCHW